MHLCKTYRKNQLSYKYFTIEKIEAQTEACLVCNRAKNLNESL